MIREFINIFENENFVIDYDSYNKQYRVVYYENGNFVKECFFDEYKDEDLKFMRRKYTMLNSIKGC
jgi:hypothetical protein